MSSSDNPGLDNHGFESPIEPQPVVNAGLPVAGVADAFAAVSLNPPGYPPVPVAPPRDPVWSGWDVLLIALLTIATMFVVEVVIVVGALFLAYPHSSFAEVAQKPILALISQFLSYIAVAVFMIMLVEGKYHEPFWRAIRWNWPSSNLKLVGLMGLGILTILLDALGNRFLPLPKSTPFDQFFARRLDAYLVAVFAVTFGPLMEELFFRGFLYPVLARRTGVIAAVLLTSLPFGAMHYLQYKSWSAVLVITLVGVVLTTVRAVTQSVAASFLVHIGYNGILMAGAAVATDGFRHMDKVGVALF